MLSSAFQHSPVYYNVQYNNDHRANSENCTIYLLVHNEKRSTQDNVIKMTVSVMNNFQVRIFKRCVTIRKTCPCDSYPLTPHFYIVKMGFTGVYIIFLFLL